MRRSIVDICLGGQHSSGCGVRGLGFRGFSIQGPGSLELFFFIVVELPFVTASCEVSRGEKMLDSGTDPGSYITEYTLFSIRR